VARLPQGIYEALLDEDLNSILQRHPELRSVLENSTQRRAGPLRRLSCKALGKALQLEDDPATRLRLCNQIIERIAGNPTTEFLKAAAYRGGQSLLLEITPPNYAQGGMLRPETALVESSLFTGSPADHNSCMNWEEKCVLRTQWTCSYLSSSGRVYVC